MLGTVMVSNIMLSVGVVVSFTVFYRAGEKWNAVGSAFFILLLLYAENPFDPPLIIRLLCMINCLYAYRFFKAFYRINPIDGF